MRIELKCFRIRENLTQKDMASKLNMSKMQYGRIENGICNPSYKVLERFVEVFKVDNVFELFKND